jgi:hypothetical protein
MGTPSVVADVKADFRRMDVLETVTGLVVVDPAVDHRLDRAADLVVSDLQAVTLEEAVQVDVLLADQWAVPMAEDHGAADPWVVLTADLWGDRMADAVLVVRKMVRTADLHTISGRNPINGQTQPIVGDQIYCGCSASFSAHNRLRQDANPGSPVRPAVELSYPVVVL